MSLLCRLGLHAGLATQRVLDLEWHRCPRCGWTSDALVRRWDVAAPFLGW